MSQGTLFIKLKKRYIKVLMEIFGRNKIDKTKLRKFATKMVEHGLGKRSTYYDKLSIIVPCFNHAEFLPAMFESIINQTLLPDEVIFINDASTDNSGEIIKNIVNQYFGKKINFKIIDVQKNQGQTASINKAVPLAKNELIMILNDDDYLMHDAVANTLDIFNREKEIYLLGSKTINFSNDQYLKNQRKMTFDHIVADTISVRKFYPDDLLKSYRNKGLDMAHTSMAFIRIAWKAAGGYLADQSDRVIMYSDRDFQVRVSVLFPIGVIEDAPFSFWRVNSSVDAGLFT